MKPYLINFNKTLLKLLGVMLLLGLISYVGQVSALEKVSNYRVAITHPLKIPDSGSIEEALSLSKEWRDKVLLKNEKILDVEYLLEKKSETNYLLLVIYHYENKETAIAANALIGSLISKAWPNKDERQTFFTKLQSYVVQEKKETFKFEVIH